MKCKSGFGEYEISRKLNYFSQSPHIKHVFADQVMRIWFISKQLRVNGTHGMTINVRLKLSRFYHGDFFRRELVKFVHHSLCGISFRFVVTEKSAALK
jgi:hypothetical protein